MLRQTYGGIPRSSHCYNYCHLLIAPSLFPDHRRLQHTLRLLSELAHEVHTDGKLEDIDLLDFFETLDIFLRILDSLAHLLGENKKLGPLSGIFGFVDNERRMESLQQAKKRVNVSLG